MSETEEKMCFKFNYPKKFLCISLENGALGLAMITILTSIVHIGIASYLISLGPDVTDFGELVVDKSEVVDKARLIFSFYIMENTREDWEYLIKLNGGKDIAFSLISLIASFIGLVGVLKRKPILVYFLFIGVGFYIGVWIGDIFQFALNSDDFTISSGVAWTLTVVLMIATFSLIYFPLCVYSLYLKLRKEKNGELEQVPEKTFYIIRGFASPKTKTKADPGFKCFL